MRVKVSYTVDIEEVSSLVQDLLSSIRSRLTKHSDVSASVFTPEKTIESLLEIQRDISVVEAQTSDCINIIQGFLSALNEHSQAEEAPDLSPETIDEEN
tara:strand:- start:5875 stop:6171 length:297 start_codon:yes stop_codon:yes gene_type:complete